MAVTGDFQPWFRGQTKSSYKLQPGLFRGGLRHKENDLRAEFARCAPQYMTERPPHTDWEWYFLMQHFGIPTRLLDWSDGALIALFFALHSPLGNRDDEEDAAVWMLDPWWLNKQTLGDESVLAPDFPRAKSYLSEPYPSKSFKLPTGPAAIDPPYIAKRVAVQRGHFTVFGSKRHGLDELWKRGNTRLEKIILAKEHLESMRQDLATLGVTDTTIFPELAALSKELVRYWERP